ncbi:MAG TPA: outer membrane beta-barrel protein [Myxococcota bacterium]|nr:outer membrane beta-barrel protein [Myxococcota bacterium]
MIALSLRGIAAVGACAVLTWAARAAAEDEADRFHYNASALVTLVGDDDPYLEQRDEGAFGGYLAPSLEVGYRADVFELNADLGADLRRYIDEKALSEEFYRAIVSGEVGILPGVSLRVMDSFRPEAELISSPADATRNLQQTNRAGAELRFWRELSGRRELLATLRGSHFTGEDFNAVLATDGSGFMTHLDFEPDHAEGAGTLEFQTPLGERNSVYARSELLHRSYHETEVADRSQFTIQLGARTRRFRNVEIDVAGGFGMVVFESRDDLRSFVGDASLRYRLPNGWTWRVSAANRFVTDLAGSTYVETTGRMGFEKHFGEWLSTSIAAFVSQLENDAWNLPHNLFGGAEVRVQSRVGRHTTVAFTYRYWDNAGNYALDDFNQDRVAIEFFYRR